jgi:DnaJ like chaperone protein
MSIWGKILGGAAGFALGGPLGALLGAAAGHVVDGLHSAIAGEAGPGAGGEAKDQTQTIAFTAGVIALGAKMAKADGVVARSEVDAFKRVFRVPPEELKNVGRVFDIARQDSAGFEPYARQLARMFADRPAVLEELLGGLFHIARADGTVHASELRYLREVAGLFGFSAETFERLRRVHGVEDVRESAEEDPYAILGIAGTASDEEVKAAYRRLIREHHPDRLIAQGVPQEFIDVANARMAAINAAHDAVQRQRARAKAPA